VTTRKRPPDLYIAFKAVALARELTRNEALVAGALLAHFNVKTGQCDPSVNRLGTMLGIARSKVLKATAAICGGASDGKHLFDKRSHGGKSHRASYAPKWDRLAAIVADWESRMAGGDDGPEKGDVDGPQKGDVDGPQKGDTNSLKELFEGTLGARKGETSVSVTDRCKGLGRNGAKLPKQQHSMIFAIPGGKSPSRADVADEQAKRRICQQISGTDVEAWLATEDPRNVYFDAAVKQEINRRGWGLHWLRERMMNHRLTADRARGVGV